MADDFLLLGGRVAVNLPSFGYEEGSFSLRVIEETLTVFHDALGVPPSEFPLVYIYNDPEAPCPQIVEVKLCDSHVSAHRIRLTLSRGTLWSQLVYQLAHEYCHHLTNKEIEGSMAGLRWFEETLCEAASQFCILHLSMRQRWGQEDCRYTYVPSLRDYLHSLWCVDDFLWSDCCSAGWLSRWEATLADGAYHRAHYRAIARLIVPLFDNNPRLWRLLLSVGDTARYKSLADLFAALDSAAEEDWRGSYQALKRILMG